MGIASPEWYKCVVYRFTPLSPKHNLVLHRKLFRAFDKKFFPVQRHYYQGQEEQHPSTHKTQHKCIIEVFYKYLLWSNREMFYLEGTMLVWQHLTYTIKVGFDISDLLSFNYGVPNCLLIIFHCAEAIVCHNDKQRINIIWAWFIGKNYPVMLSFYVLPSMIRFYSLCMLFVFSEQVT